MGTDLQKRQPARLAWFAGCLGAGLCALASKQNAAMLPISLVCLEIFLLQPQKKQAKSVPLVKIILPPVLIFILLSAYFGGFSSLQAGFAYRPFTMLERLLTQPRVIFFYIGQLLCPTGSEFALLHDIQVSTSLLSPGTTLPAILLLIGCISACFFLRRRWPLFAFGYLFFFLNHAIEGSIVPLELIFEHRNYLPSFFFFILPAVALLKVVAYFAFSPMVRRLGIICAALIIMAQMHTTYVQNRLYTDPVFFWTLNVKAYPDLHRPRHNLAKAMFLAGLEDEAERQMYLSLEGKSVARKSQKFATLYNLGVFYFYKMEYQRAMQLFSVFLKSSPNHVNALKIIAELYMELGETEKAQQAIVRALALAPENSSLHIIKGYILLARGDIDGAFAAADMARALNHNKIGVGYIKAEGFRLKKEYEKAINQFNNIMRLEQDHYAALLSLIELYYLTGRQTLLKQAVGKLNRIGAGQTQSQILLIYNQRWNFVGKQRMTNLAAAMRE